MAELFEKFEINRESRRATLLRLLSASLLFHLGIVWAALYVPAFRDALNVASLIANTRFVEKPYVATEIGDDVQLLDLAKEKFHYPAGYFATDFNAGSQPGTVAAQFDPFAPKIISRASDERQEPAPSPSPSPSPSVAVASASPSPATNANTAELNPEEAQKKLEQSAAENNIQLPSENEINKQVLKDFAAFANDLKNQGKLDLNKPFEIVIEAELDENGKLKDPRVTRKAGDENLVDLFTRMISALNDSGLLIYLKPINNDNPGAKIVFTIKQGENEVEAQVESEAKSTDSARILAKALNGSLVLGALSRKGKDEAELMKNTNVAPDGRRILINFSMSRQSLVDMIKKQLEPGA
jgi:hypothetical protein